MVVCDCVCLVMFITLWCSYSESIITKFILTPRCPKKGVHMHCTHLLSGLYEGCMKGEDRFLV